MKWVCVVVLVLDLLLVAAAAFRLATVPPKSVAAVEDKIIARIDETDALLEQMKAENAGTWEEERDILDGESSEGAGDAPAGEGVDYKNIDLNEKTLETYDDQAEKEKALDSAGDEIQKRFGSK